MKKLLAAWLLLFPAILLAQANAPQSSANILHDLKKLNTVGRVLYIAAHPDDENTRLITWLANNERVEVAYLSLTRGDGGQNLIGNEIGAELGLIRTQELLAARRIDGGSQFFTRAIDFGFSKSAEESFEIWNKNEITKDVIWIIRNYQPDVIISRFPPNDRAGHGHHIASGILCEEVFEMAADPKVFPEQLKYVSAWQVKQVFLNVSTWWDKDLPERAKTDPSIISMEVGQFEPLLGQSMGEVAARSRSQHQSQGFGSELQRGTNTEYLQLVKGSHEGATLFSEAEKNWSSIKGAEKINALIAEIEKKFDPDAPELSVPGLVNVAKAIRALPENRFKKSKLALAESLIARCAGLWFEANAATHEAVAGKPVKVDISLLNRSNLNVKINGLKVHQQDTLIAAQLLFNQALKIPFQLGAEPNHQPTEQYWLTEKPGKGLFKVDNTRDLLKPESTPTFMASAQVEIEEYSFNIEFPVQYKWVDRAKGELIRNLRVVPEITVNPREEVVLFPNQQASKVKIMLRAHAENISGTLRPILPEGWVCEPAEANFSIAKKFEELVLSFTITPGKGATTGFVKWQADLNGKKFTQSEKEISYDHIPVQNLLYPAQFRAVNFELKTSGSKIGYLAGSGDDGPKALESMGYQVTMLDIATLGTADLSGYDAIITGIRAYNTLEGLVGVNHVLLDYVKNGGNLIVQYNVNRGLVTETIGPYPFKIGRDRVTDETAATTFVDKNHPILNAPNKLTSVDFAGWVQERGLYFAESWDDAYQPVIIWNDRGEKPLNGALIVAKHGEGAFIYTGISFFRQLPAGTPGAYRLLANLIAFGKDE
jgi:LmbE family N-acetylglucosaminyl deacetylase